MANPIQQLARKDVHTHTDAEGTPLNQIDRWLQRAAARTNRVISLYPSLLTGRPFTYFGYRLRYPFLISVVRFAVHVAEFFILLSSLGGLATFTVMVLRAGSLLVSGGWWGLLELMRERLRVFARTGQREASEREIGSWLVLSLVLAVLLTIGGGAALVLLQAAGDDPLARLYAFLVIVELAIGLPVRVLHSGIYATRRVYKPVASMFAPTVAQLAVLSLGFFFYPTAAIITSIVVSNALSIWITVHYTLEVYRLMGLRPRHPGTGRRWPRLPSIPPLRGFQAALSGLSLRIDAVLVLALVGFYGTSTRSFDLTAGSAAWRHVDAFQFFYLVLPLFRGTYESAAIFYFDLVRLRSAPALRQLQLVFFRRLLWAAPVIALFYWSLAAVLGVVVLHDVPVSFLLALIPLFVVRAFIGIYQIRLFADGRFGTHIASLASLVVLLGLVWMEPNPASDLIQITAVMITQLVILIDVQHLRDRRDPPLPTLLPVGEWMRSLSREPGPVSAGRFSLPRAISSKQRSSAVDLTCQEIGDNGHLAFSSPTSAVYYRRHTDADADADADAEAGGAGIPDRTPVLLGSLTGGLAGNGRALEPPAEDGRRALARSVARRWVPTPPDGDGQAPSLRALGTEFRRLFPEGAVFDTTTLAGGRNLRNREEGLLVGALPAAIGAVADGLDLVAVSEHWVMPAYRGGELRLLFVLPRDVEQERLQGWLQTLRVWRADPDGTSD